MDKNVKIQTYHIGLFAQFLEKMRATPDGDGSLLDHSMLLYGSNMSNSNAHNHFPLPNLVVGGAAGRLKGGRHLEYPDHTPMTNLLLTRAGQGRRPTGNLGDSTGNDGGTMTIVAWLRSCCLPSRPRRLPARTPKLVVRR